MYRADQAGQIRGMIWYLPYAPVMGFSAEKRPPDSTQASPVMNETMSTRE